MSQDHRWIEAGMHSDSFQANCTCPQTKLQTADVFICKKVMCDVYLPQCLWCKIYMPEDDVITPFALSKMAPKVFEAHGCAPLNFCNSAPTAHRTFYFIRNTLEGRLAEQVHLYRHF